MMNDLIYYLEKNEINYYQLPSSINIIKFNKKEEIKSFLENDSLVLINIDFLLSLNYDFSKKSIQFDVFNILQFKYKDYLKYKY